MTQATIGKGSLHLFHESSSSLCMQNTCTHVHCTYLLQEQEKVDLLESYQALSDEAEKLDSTVQHSLGETSTTRMELATLTQVGQIWKVVIKIGSPPLPYQLCSRTSTSPCLFVCLLFVCCWFCFVCFCCLFIACLFVCLLFLALPIFLIKSLEIRLLSTVYSLLFYLLCRKSFILKS